MKIKIQSGEGLMAEKITKLFPSIPEDKTISKKNLTEKEVQLALTIYSNITLLHKYLKFFIIIHLVIIFFGWGPALIPFIYRSKLTAIINDVKENGYVALKNHIDTLKKWKRISFFYGTFAVKGLSTIIVRDCKLLVPKEKKAIEQNAKKDLSAPTKVSAPPKEESVSKPASKPASKPVPTSVVKKDDKK